MKSLLHVQLVTSRSIHQRRRGPHSSPPHTPDVATPSHDPPNQRFRIARHFFSNSTTQLAARMPVCPKGPARNGSHQDGYGTKNGATCHRPIATRAETKKAIAIHQHTTMPIKNSSDQAWRLPMKRHQIHRQFGVDLAINFIYTYFSAQLACVLSRRSPGDHLLQIFSVTGCLEVVSAIQMHDFSFLSSPVTK